MLDGANQIMIDGGAANSNEGRLEFISFYRSRGRFPAEWHTLGVVGDEQSGTAAGQ